MGKTEPGPKDGHCSRAHPFCVQRSPLKCWAHHAWGHVCLALGSPH